MKTLFFVIMLSLVAMSASGQSTYIEVDTILVKTGFGYDTLILPTDNQIFSGTEAGLEINNLEKYFLVSMEFSDGSRLDYRIPFPVGMKGNEEVKVMGWFSTRPIAKKSSTKIDFEINGESYIFTSSGGWTKG